jgi:hypothetical protein
VASGEWRTRGSVSAGRMISTQFCKKRTEIQQFKLISNLDVDCPCSVHLHPLTMAFVQDNFIFICESLRQKSNN